MVKNKIKSLLSLKGLTFADYARKLEIKPQSLQTKSKKNAYKLDDLVQLAELTDTTLALVDSKGDIAIEFNKDDLSAE